MTVGERIKQRRIELGLTQDELAKKVGYKSRSSINKIEISRNMPLPKVDKLATALECSRSYLLGWDEETVEDSPALQAIERSDNENVLDIGNRLYKSHFVEKYLNEETMAIIKEYSKADDYIKKAIRDLLKIEDNDNMGGIIQFRKRRVKHRSRYNIVKR